VSMKIDTVVTCGWTTQPCARENEHCPSGTGGGLNCVSVIWMWRVQIVTGLWICRGAQYGLGFAIWALDGQRVNRSQRPISIFGKCQKCPSHFSFLPSFRSLTFLFLFLPLTTSLVFLHFQFLPLISLTFDRILHFLLFFSAFFLSSSQLLLSFLFNFLFLLFLALSFVSCPCSPSLQFSSHVVEARRLGGHGAATHGLEIWAA
jgi:hypothetical protein